MEKFIVSVGGMWVAKVIGDPQEDGRILGIKTIELTSDKSKALQFESHGAAKSVANRIKTYGCVEKL